MNQEPPKQPIELNIDVEQWRRDIKTFSETTSQALDTIISQLSTNCSTELRRFTGQIPENVTRTAPPLEVNESGSDKRLEKLKSQLANRISKTN